FSFKVIITGGPQDIDLAEKIKSLMLEKPFILAGRLNLKQFASLCKRLDLFISADSGPLHIANTVNTKRIIALFGPTSLVNTSPYPLDRVKILKKEIDCRIPCYNLNCKDNQCMKRIRPEDVIQKLEEFDLTSR
ncbi:MAG: glycosyltransferase family 9 protein, partial [Candidatus Omnitrophica bacterium]|nr:glycosyltransferase family 9 protein [Candidatus Omnitrophota bacterium]